MSETLKEQQEVIKALKKMHGITPTELLKKEHISYMSKNLVDMGKAIIYFDYGHSWVYYYILNSLYLLGKEVPEELQQLIIQSLKYCQNEKYGGFGGGYKQLPHLATTYAAFLSVLIIGKKAYHLLDKQALTKFFWSCKKNGEFQMTDGAEFDLRAIYIVIIIVKLLHLDEKLLDGVAQTIISSQTYEGGLSNVIGGEAHGGYTFCGVAGLSMLGRLQDLDIPRLAYWLNHRQTQFGGFSGRTNKLLDSCYSFWVGAIFNIINNYFQKKVSIENQLIYNEEGLQKYITFYCQNTQGGLWDKPGKSRDVYHTCYALSGLAISQETFALHESDKLRKNDPIYNIGQEKLREAQIYFDAL